MRRLKPFIAFCCGLLCFLTTAISHADTILEDLNNTPISWSSLKGKWVFINVWASWCGPCVEEISELNRFYEANKHKNVMVYAVNYDALPLFKQQRLIRKFSIRYPSLKLNTVARLHLGDLSVVPVTYVFNPEGELTTALYGGQTYRSFKEVLATSQEQPSKWHA